jgi:imidazolonepropionase-like amidohydrolase
MIENLNLIQQESCQGKSTMREHGAANCLPAEGTAEAHVAPVARAPRFSCRSPRVASASANCRMAQPGRHVRAGSARAPRFRSSRCQGAIAWVALVMSWGLAHGLLPTPLWAAPEIPGAPQSEPIVLVGATLHPISGPPIPAGMLLFEEGRIVALGKMIKLPPRTRRIELKGKHVYPALFDACTDLGLVEISSVRGSRDEAETGRLNPNVKSWLAINPDSELIPVTRANGVLLALTAPFGGLLAGQSAVVQLDGWTYEEMTLQPSVGMHVNWPRADRAADGSDAARARDRALAPLREALDHARAYRLAKQHAETSPPDLDLRWESMQPLLDRQLPLIVHANELTAIQDAVAFANAQKLRLILHGGYDAPLCARLLVEHDVPVIVEGVYRLPQRRNDPYDMAYTVPARLRDAGVRFCIAGAGRGGASNARNLPYHAAMAAAFGLPPEEALQAITLAPAQILGVADRVGSLEVGKHATLIVTDGNPLETFTQVDE